MDQELPKWHDAKTGSRRAGMAPSRKPVVPSDSNTTIGQLTGKVQSRAGPEAIGRQRPIAISAGPNRVESISI